MGTKVINVAHNYGHMSIDVKRDRYVYLRYYDTGNRVELYVGKFNDVGDLDIKPIHVDQASRHFYKQSFRNYKIAHLLKTDPQKAVEFLRNKEEIDEKEFYEWLKRQHISVGRQTINKKNWKKL
jgi:hypothetical protein